MVPRVCYTSFLREKKSILQRFSNFKFVPHMLRIYWKMSCKFGWNFPLCWAYANISYLLGWVYAKIGYPHCKDKIPIFRNKYSQKRNIGVSALSPNFHIHASVSDLYIPTICLPILLEEICRPILGLYKSLTDTWMLKLGLRPRHSQKRNT
jgi:hypothetical protein